MRSIALQVGTSSTYPGNRKRFLDDDDEIIRVLKGALGEIDRSQRVALLSNDNLSGRLGKMLTGPRVLVVIASPLDQAQIRVASEARTIREAIERGRDRDRIHVRVLMAATPDDLRRALLDEEFEILHISGHADENGPIAETESGDSMQIPLSALRDLVARYTSIECVVLNACYSAKALTESLASVTVGMDASLEDEAAIDFARGFYDAIGAGRAYEEAIKEGKSAAELKGRALPLRVLKRPATQAG